MNTSQTLFILFLLVLIGALPIYSQTTPHPFSVNDLVILDRISDPVVAPDGNKVL